jgi:hypothetical protein
MPPPPRLRVGPRRGLTSQNTSHNAAVGSNGIEGGASGEASKMVSEGGSNGGSGVIASQDFGGGKTAVYRGVSVNGMLREDPRPRMGLRKMQWKVVTPCNTL